MAIERSETLESITQSVASQLPAPDVSDAGEIRSQQWMWR